MMAESLVEDSDYWTAVFDHMTPGCRFGSAPQAMGGFSWSNSDSFLTMTESSVGDSDYDYWTAVFDHMAPMCRGSAPQEVGLLLLCAYLKCIKFTLGDTNVL